MRRPSKLPMYRDPARWPLRARLGAAACLMGLGALLMALWLWPVAVAHGVGLGLQAGADNVRAEVRAACGCWFNDSRCDHTVVACRQLEWMKE
jgi:hypothetical protein